ncbi:hypothetical protein [Polaromonas sp.]
MLKLPGMPLKENHAPASPYNMLDLALFHALPSTPPVVSAA